MRDGHAPCNITSVPPSPHAALESFPLPFIPSIALPSLPLRSLHFLVAMGGVLDRPQPRLPSWQPAWETLLFWPDQLFLNNSTSSTTPKAVDAVAMHVSSVSFSNLLAPSIVRTLPRAQGAHKGDHDRMAQLPISGLPISDGFWSQESPVGLAPA